MVEKRKGSPNYYVRFVIDGEEIRRSTGTSNRRQAEEFEHRLRLELYNEKKLGIRPKYKLAEAIIRYVEESEMRGLSISQQNTDKTIFGWFVEQLSPDFPLEKIDKQMLIDLQKKIYAMPVVLGPKNGRYEQQRSAVSVNKYLARFCALLNRAHKEWEWISSAPTIKPLPEQEKSPRWITYTEAKKLIEACPEHLKNMVRFSLATGLRQANVCFLEWREIDFENKRLTIEASKMKSRKTFNVPLSDSALEILIEQMDIHPRYVFTLNGHPLSEIKHKTFL